MPVTEQHTFDYMEHEWGKYIENWLARDVVEYYDGQAIP